MKCVHCNGEHPDGFKFCPVTGKEILQSFKACTNPECVDFEKHILPPDALFCPRCGSLIEGFSERKENDENCHGVKNTFTEMLFPIYGVTLGQTTIREVDERYISNEDSGILYEPDNTSAQFLLGQEVNQFCGVRFNDSCDIPLKLNELGFKWGMKTREIHKIAHKYNLILLDSTEYEYYLKDYEDVVALISGDKKHLLIFIFNYQGQLSEVIIEYSKESSFFTHSIFAQCTKRGYEANSCPMCHTSHKVGFGNRLYVCFNCGFTWS